VEENRALVQLAAAALATSSSLTVVNNPALEVVQLPLLNLIARDDSIFSPEVQVLGNLALTEFELPALQTATSLRIYSNTLLKSLRFPSMRQLSSISIFQNLLTELSLPVLETLGPSPSIGGVDISSSSLRELHLPALKQVAGWCSISAEGLQVLDIPQLSSIGRLSVLSDVMEELAAPALTRIEEGLLVRAELKKFTVPVLSEGCGKLSRPVPDCALGSALPSCPPAEVQTIAGCSCDPGDDLSAAECPEAAETP
jgi:hypothetical protein